MKLLVLSDSHKNIDRMLLAAEQTNPNAILHLGDHIADAQELRRRLPDVPFHIVKGNCDFQAVGETFQFLTFDGVRVYMTHGHIHNVKSGLDALLYRALELKADIALYGHTHQAFAQPTHGIWLMNPGQMERNDRFRPASFGVVTIENGKFECKIETF